MPQATAPHKYAPGAFKLGFFFLIKGLVSYKDFLELSLDFQRSHRNLLMEMPTKPWAQMQNYFIGLKPTTRAGKNEAFPHLLAKSCAPRT